MYVCGGECVCMCVLCVDVCMLCCVWMCVCVDVCVCVVVLLVTSQSLLWFAVSHVIFLHCVHDFVSVFLI